MKKEVRKALAKAKELEAIPDDSMDEIVRIYKEGMEEAEKMRGMLKPSWFIKDVHPKKKAKKKAAKKAKKKVKKKKVKTSRAKRNARSPSRKKKSL